MYTLEELGQLDVPGSVEGIDSDANYLYISTRDSDVPYDYGLAIVDISDKSDPQLAGICTTPGWALDIVSEGNYAYIGDHFYGIQIIDVTDRTKPLLLSSYNTPGYANTVDGDPDNVYVLDAYDIRIIDVANKTDPVYASLYNTSTEIQDIKAGGNYLYFVEDENNNPDVGVKVLDISNNTNPVLAGEFTGIRLRRVTVDNTYAYVMTWDHKLVIFDITNPTDPVYMGECHLGFAKEIVVEGAYVYLVSTDGLYVVDVSDPTQPLNMGLYNYSNLQDISVDGEYLYCLFSTYNTADVIIYQRNAILPSGTPTPEPTIDPATPTPELTMVPPTPTPESTIAPSTPTPTTAPTLGDVNNSGTVDIVDALLIAQYYVGLDPQVFFPEAADVIVMVVWISLMPYSSHNIT